MNLFLFANSLIVAGVTATLAAVLGTGVAIAGRAWGGRMRGALLLLAGLTLVFPPFVVAAAWLKLFEAGGFPLDRLAALGQGAAGPWGTASAAALAGLPLGFLFWPIVTFLADGAWEKLQPIHFESEPALTGASLFRWLLWPAARGAVVAGLLAVLVLSLAHFTVPALLQVKVVAVEMWMAFNTQLDERRMLEVAVPLLVTVCCLTVWLSRRELPWPRVSMATPAALFRRQIGRWLFAVGNGMAAIALTFSLVVPLGHLLTDPRWWTEMLPAFSAGKATLFRSCLLAALAATGAVGTGWICARWRWGGLLWVAFVVPGAFLGIVWIHVWQLPALRWFYPGLVVVLSAWIIRHAAISLLVSRRAREAMDLELRDVVRLEGATGPRLWYLATWTQVRRPLLAAGYAIYLLCLWEVETLLLLVPPGGETAALRIFNFLHYGHTAQVNALSMWLLGCAALPLLGVAAAGLLTRSAWLRGLPLWAVLMAGLLGAGCEAQRSDRARLGSRLFQEVRVIGTRGTGLGQFNKPRSVALDRSDQLFVVDMTGRVQKMSNEGAYLGYWQMPETDLGKPKGMARDEQGRIVVLEPHYARLNYFDPDGRLVEQWGTPGTGLGEFILPRAVAVASNGWTYVSEYSRQDRITLFQGEKREPKAVIGHTGSGPGEFQRPEGLGLDGEGRLYVADSCNHRVQVFDPGGRFLRIIGRPGSANGELSYPYDVAIDASGNIYVCEFGNSRVQVFDPEGRTIEVLGGAGVAPPRMNNPWSIALDSRGNLFVADALNHRVLKFIRRGAG